MAGISGRGSRKAGSPAGRVREERRCFEQVKEVGTCGAGARALKELYKDGYDMELQKYELTY